MQFPLGEIETVRGNSLSFRDDKKRKKLGRNFWIELGRWSDEKKVAERAPSSSPATGYVNYTCKYSEATEPRKIER